jgi:hypothetical protein
MADDVLFAGCDGGSCHALHAYLRLDEVAGLIDRPLAIARPADLATVAAVQALRLRPEANTAIGLLRACLEHRFGSGAAEDFAETSR